METLHYNFSSKQCHHSTKEWVLVGVVGSGNLELLVEKTGDEQCCNIEIRTSLHGFSEIWRAVLSEFVLQRDVGGLKLSINDAGATPAVVFLRLQQALDEFENA